MGEATECGFLFHLNLYIYSDESGTFDAKNNPYFIFGGVICFGDAKRHEWSRRYIHCENALRNTGKYKKEDELKASFITNAEKGKFYRSLNRCYKFALIIHEANINPSVFENKRHKQRYLDYAYKIVLKKCLEHVLSASYIQEGEVKKIHVYADEHRTCTDSVYELREALLNEFRLGTFNATYETFFPPIFPSLDDVRLYYCDSKKVALIRASDIVANHFYHKAHENRGKIASEPNTFIMYLPSGIIASYGDDHFTFKESFLAMAKPPREGKPS